MRARSSIAHAARVAWLIGWAAAACSNGSFSAESDLDERLNSCERDSDCRRGTCDPELNSCVAASPALPSLLVDVLPPTFGSGLVTGDTLMAVSDLTASMPMRIPVSSVLNGVVSLSAGDPSCRPSPVRINLSPVSRSLGINAERYTASTRLDTRITNHQYIDSLVFNLHGVADGEYDIYMQDAREIDNSGRPACQVAPWVVRAQKVTPSDGQPFTLEQSPARPLTVTVPFIDGLVGWHVDIVHPLTGEQLSSEVQLTESSLVETPTERLLVAELRLTEVEGKDWAEPGTELLRLRPPSGYLAPAIFMSLSALEVHVRGQAVLPKVNPFGRIVKYRAWVWQGGTARRPVPGSVTFNALRLSELPQFRTHLVRTVPIGAEGQIEVELPPGTYTVQVLPAASSGSSKYETEVVVWAPADRGAETPEQAGAVLNVPKAATVTGRVRFDGKVPPLGTRVRLVADQGRVLDRRPGQLPFQARDSEGLLDERGSFSIEGVDCRTCTPDGEGASYTLTVMPPNESGLPWLVRTRLVVKADVNLQEVLGLSIPNVYRMSIEPEQKKRTSLPARFRVRAFVSVDRAGRPLLNPDTVPCARLAPQDADTTQCATQAIAVAEASGDDTSGVSLLLPQEVLPIQDPGLLPADAGSDPVP
jgi:hypothetical protein